MIVVWRSWSKYVCIVLATLVLVVACTSEGSTERSSQSTTTLPAQITGTVSTSPDPGMLGVVEGQVRSADGQPISEVQILARPVGTVIAPLPERLPITDDQGAYRWELPGGTIELTAYKTGFTAAVQTVDVVPGQTLQLNFTMQPGS